jgi:hypothetical protein
VTIFTRLSGARLEAFAFCGRYLELRFSA